MYRIPDEKKIRVIVDIEAKSRELNGLLWGTYGW